MDGSVGATRPRMALSSASTVDEGLARDPRSPGRPGQGSSSGQTLSTEDLGDRGMARDAWRLGGEPRAWVGAAGLPGGRVWRRKGTSDWRPVEGRSNPLWSERYPVTPRARWSGGDQNNEWLWGESGSTPGCQTVHRESCRDRETE
jgi:hypothetical protein